MQMLSRFVLRNKNICSAFNVKLPWLSEVVRPVKWYVMSHAARFSIKEDSTPAIKFCFLLFLSEKRNSWENSTLRLRTNDKQLLGASIVKKW